jgi:hypothetical protein
MPLVDTKAEDTSINHHFDHSIATTTNASDSRNSSNVSGEVTQDVEKQNVNNNEGPALEAVTKDSANNDVEKGVLKRTLTRETHTSSVSATPYDDKDDFPEGGLRGWGVVLGAFCGSFR